MLVDRQIWGCGAGAGAITESHLYSTDRGPNAIKGTKISEQTLNAEHYSGALDSESDVHGTREHERDIRCQQLGPVLRSSHRHHHEA
jgi:hypothetical protein